MEQKDGPALGMAQDRFIEQDGLLFRDLTGSGELYPYEDWRLDADTRARDLAARLSVEEIAGLMLYSSHQTVPAVQQGPFTGHYSGKSMEDAGADRWDLTDEQKCLLEKDNIRHILLASVSDPETSARWSNELQKAAEALPFGIPVNISSDPRHGASGNGAGEEFKSTSGGVSVWPEGIGMTALHDPEEVRKFARVVAAEYRAMGITTALGPQIDLATEPRWMRLEDTPGTDVEYSIRFAKIFCDALQTTEGTKDGWGSGSVVAMAKHWPGGGPCEAGRDAHYAFGKYAVYPGGGFEDHLRVFTEGALALDGPTKTAGAIMPYYTVSWGQDRKNGENVGNSYSEYLIRDLLRERYGYDGIVCTDWGITEDPAPQMDSFGSRCYGVEHLSEAERHLRIIMNGVDQFGGNNRKQPILDAYQIGCDRYGETVMRKRMEDSARRLLRSMFRLGLFENPYLDPEASARIVGNAQFRTEGRKAQAASVVLLKNKNGTLPLRKGIRVYVPERTIRARKSFFRMMMPEAQIRPLSERAAEGFCTLTDCPEEADAAIVFMESPSSDPYCPADVEEGGNGYRPILLQYRPYTADAARAVSIAGGDFREKDVNRSYKGKSSICFNESDLDNVLRTREKMGDKPVIVCLRMHNPTVPSEFEPAASAVLCEFGTEKEVVMEILFGDREAGGVLPYHMPADMDTIERHCEDLADDYEAYTDSEGRVWRRGYSFKEEA